MSNLLQETMRDLRKADKTEDDVLWVGSPEYRIPWKRFVKLADKKYDNGYGSQEVVRDLLIVGKDWWLEREEYDGAEGWTYKELPEMPVELYTGNTLFPKWGWSDLSDIMEEEDA